MSTVLFTRPDSIYKRLGADCWDAQRDARLYLGTEPVIAHPPCRAWGNMAHWSKHTLWEKSHAIWTLQLIRTYGGIMEHPATSRIKDYLTKDDNTLIVDQHWWNHPAQKRTILIYHKVGPYPPMPLSLQMIGRPIEQMSKRQREQTPPKFAEWLLEWLKGARVGIP